MEHEQDALEKLGYKKQTINGIDGYSKEKCEYDDMFYVVKKTKTVDFEACPELSFKTILALAEIIKEMEKQKK